MKTPQLEQILSHILPKEKVDFLGVFPRDLIPNDISHYPACYVANTDPSTKPGAHWVAFYLESPKKSEFFDSYGFHPRVYGFTNHVTSYNHTQYQSFASSVCGQFCVLYLYTRTNCCCPIDTHFSKSNHYWNDRKVDKWVRSLRFSRTPPNPCISSRCIQSCTCHKK